MAIRTVYKSGNFKVCYNSEWQEYQVGLASLPSSKLADHGWTYFTDDRQDAIATCIHMNATFKDLETTNAK